MTLCRQVVCSVSTFSWWGAWLNPSPGKAVVAPREWIRPGHMMKSPELNCKDWILLRTCRLILDDYRFLMWTKMWEQRLERMRARSFKEKLFSLGYFLKNKARQLIKPDQ